MRPRGDHNASSRAPLGLGGGLGCRKARLQTPLVQECLLLLQLVVAEMSLLDQVRVEPLPTVLVAVNPQVLAPKPRLHSRAPRRDVADEDLPDALVGLGWAGARSR